MRTLVALAALTSLVALPACTSEASSAAGTYSVEVDTTGMSEQEVQTVNSAFKLNDLTLGADGKWNTSMEVSVMGDEQTMTEKGTWKLAGGEIVLTTTHKNGEAVEPQDHTASYADGAFSLEYEQAGRKMKFDMKKK